MYDDPSPVLPLFLIVVGWMIWECLDTENPCRRETVICQTIHEFVD